MQTKHRQFPALPPEAKLSADTTSSPVVNWNTEPPSPLLKDVLAYWESRCGNGRIPTRAAIDPLHIPRLLPRVALIDVLREPLDFRYRIVGTGIVNHLAVDYTGSCFSELADHRPSSAAFRFAEALAEARQPGWARIPVVGPDHFRHLAVILGAPLSEDGSTVSMLLWGIDFYIWRGDTIPPTKKPREIL